MRVVFKRTRTYNVKLEFIFLKNEVLPDRMYLLRETICRRKDDSPMPATPRERLKTPLRKLRVILGDYGAPMSQEEFAAQTGLSVDTVQAIENGRRNLTDNVLRIISTRWLAMWNPQDQEWHFLQTKKLYSKELAAKVLPTRPEAEEQLIRKKLHERLDDILDAARPEALPGQAMLLSQRLRDHAEETELDVDLNPTEPMWYLHGPREPITAESRTWLLAKYSRRKKEYPNRTRTEAEAKIAAQ